MRKNARFLNELKKANPIKRRKILANSGSKEIATISEISKNLLHSRFKLNPKAKRRLCKYKRLIRRLASRKTNYKTKKRALLQKGGFGVLPLILGTIAPLIANLFASRRK
jgi:hypothetical protein